MAVDIRTNPASERNAVPLVGSRLGCACRGLERRPAKRKQMLLWIPYLGGRRRTITAGEISSMHTLPIGTTLYSHIRWERDTWLTRCKHPLKHSLLGSVAVNLSSFIILDKVPCEARTYRQVIAQDIRCCARPLCRVYLMRTGGDQLDRKD
jgi:hypothetical protein